MHLSEQVGTYYVMQHKATLLSFVPTEILWEAIRDHRMDQEAKQKKLFGDQFEHLRDIAIWPEDKSWPNQHVVLR